MVALYLERRPELTLPLLLSSLILCLHLWGSRLVCTLDYAGQIRKTSFLDVPKTESQKHSLVFALCFIRIQKCSVCMCYDLTSTKGCLFSENSMELKKYPNHYISYSWLFEIFSSWERKNCWKAVAKNARKFKRWI